VVVENDTALLQATGRGPLSPLLVYIQDLTLVASWNNFPTSFGVEWQIDATPVWRGPSCWQMLMAIFANAFLLFAIGTCI